MYQVILADLVWDALHGLLDHYARIQKLREHPPEKAAPNALLDVGNPIWRYCGPLFNHDTSRRSDELTIDIVLQ